MSRRGIVSALLCWLFHGFCGLGSLFLRLGLLVFVWVIDCVAVNVVTKMISFCVWWQSGCGHSSNPGVNPLDTPVVAQPCPPCWDGSILKGPPTSIGSYSTGKIPLLLHFQGIKGGQKILKNNKNNNNNNNNIFFFSFQTTLLFTPRVHDTYQKNSRLW